MTFKELRVGMSIQETKVIDEKLVNLFASFSGDFNEIHFDDAKAKENGFKGKIAHGMIIGSFFSKLIATDLPGEGAIYLNQNLKFIAPVYIGDTITLKLKIKKTLPSKKIIEIETIAFNEKIILVEGEAIVLFKK